MSSAVLLEGFNGLGWQLEVVIFPLKTQVILGPTLLEDLNNFPAFGVAHGAFQLRPRQIAANNVDGEAAPQHMVQRGQSTRQHWGVNLSTADSREQVHLLQLRCDGCGKSQGILAYLVATGQQHVTVAQGIGRPRNLRGVAVARFVERITTPQVAIIAITDWGKPAYFSSGEVGGADGSY